MKETESALNLILELTVRRSWERESLHCLGCELQSKLFIIIVYYHVIIMIWLTHGFQPGDGGGGEETHRVNSSLKYAPPRGSESPRTLTSQPLADAVALLKLSCV